VITSASARAQVPRLAADGRNQRITSFPPHRRPAPIKVRKRPGGFVLLIVAAAVMWPLPLPAQQSAIPVIGFLNSTSAGPRGAQFAAFDRGLGEPGYVDGRNVTIEYRWADDHYDRLPALAAELLRRQPAVIVTAGIARPQRGDGGEVWLRHASVAEALLARASHADRTPLHARVSRHLVGLGASAREVARHLEHCHLADLELDWYRRARAEAWVTWALAEARHWGELAVSAGGDQADQIALAEIEQQLGDSHRARGRLSALVADASFRGPVERPVVPTSATFWPRLTRSPCLTNARDACRSRNSFCAGPTRAREPGDRTGRVRATTQHRRAP